MSPVPTPGALVSRLKSTYWFVPSLVTLAAGVLAVTFVAVDRSIQSDANALQWVYGGGADGARALLAAVAGSTMTVVSLTLSVMVVALTVSSQHFGPRLLHSFMRDNGAQLMLGAFTGTFVYCLVVLRTVQGDGESYDRFVPHVAISVGVGLAFISVGVLIYFVHHVARSLQVSQITAGVAADLDDTIDRLYPDSLGAAAGGRTTAPPPPRGTADARAPRSGYVEDIDAERLLRVAEQHDVTVWIASRPGAFVIEGDPVARFTPGDPPRPDVARALASAFSIGADRSPQQDASFGIQQLTEVALRALSPGVNEPFTAITCIDRLSQAYRRLATRPVPDPVRTGSDGRVRVVTLPYTLPDLLTVGLEQIARAAGSNPLVVERLLTVLADLAPLVASDGDRAVVRQVGDVALQALSRSDGALTVEQRRRIELAGARLRT